MKLDLCAYFLVTVCMFFAVLLTWFDGKFTLVALMRDLNLLSFEFVL